ncbi:MAG TPA: hypothetical protein VFZ09_08465 [Archangium sp.]|uniref:hypothetical protein n=1 Tax=Archangium sp. TaxID=1872627 RepID=UPI002E35D178|nr:hypothetical protein [Archangium sp.]HEX5746264.1 hypothetical protein [Archangium sp.]
MQTVIGIDVGWSESTPSCSIAVNQNILPSEWGPERFTVRKGSDAVWCSTVQLSDAVGWLMDCRVVGQLDKAIVVIDGPVSHTGPPRPTNRWVDERCQSGQFQNRCVAAPLNGGDGQPFIVATYLLTFAAAATMKGPQYRLHPAIDWGIAGPQIFETNPTVGLGLLLPLANPAVLPSRHSGSRLHSATKQTCRAKSDWYWVEGGGHRVAEVIGAGKISETKSHQKRAAWFALAVGFQIAGIAADGSKPDWIGNPSEGIYNLLSPIHNDWLNAVASAKHPVGTGPNSKEISQSPPSGTCSTENCLLSGQPFDEKRCPFCDQLKQDQTTWAGIDSHFHYTCPEQPHKRMNFADFKKQICQKHWRR